MFFDGFLKCITAVIACKCNNHSSTTSFLININYVISGRLEHAVHDGEAYSAFLECRCQYDISIILVAFPEPSKKLMGRFFALIIGVDDGLDFLSLLPQA